MDVLVAVSETPRSSLPNGDVNKNARGTRAVSSHQTRAGQMGSTHCESLMERLNIQRKSGQYCDVTLSCKDGQIFYAHSGILAACSPYLAVLCSGSPINQVAQTRQNFVDLTQFESCVVSNLLGYIYSGSLKLSLGDTPKLLQTNSTLQVENVQDICQQFLSASIDHTNIWKILEIAHQNHLDSLTKTSTDYISKHFTDLHIKPGMMELGSEDLWNCLIQCNRSDPKKQHTESLKLETLFKWFSHQSEENIPTYADLLSAIDYQLITREQFMSLLASDTCQKNRLADHLITRNILTIAKFNSDPFKCSLPKENLAGFSSDTFSVHEELKQSLDHIGFSEPEGFDQISDTEIGGSSDVVAFKDDSQSLNMTTSNPVNGSATEQELTIQSNTNKLLSLSRDTVFRSQYGSTLSSQNDESYQNQPKLTISTSGMDFRPSLLTKISMPTEGLHLGNDKYTTSVTDCSFSTVGITTLSAHAHENQFHTSNAMSCNQEYIQMPISPPLPTPEVNPDLKEKCPTKRNVKVPGNKPKNKAKGKTCDLASLLNNEGTDTDDIDKHVKGEPHTAARTADSLIVKPTWMQGGFGHADMNDSLHPNLVQPAPGQDNQTRTASSVTLDTPDEPDSDDVVEDVDYMPTFDIDVEPLSNTGDKEPGRTDGNDVLEGSHEKKRGRIRIEGPDSYTCQKCHKTFRTACSLKHHMTGHGSDEPYLCEICGFSTKHHGSMNVHMKQHTGDKLRCDFPGCDYATIRKSRLVDHMNSHKGIKKFACEKCGKRFTGKKHLSRHERIHDNVKAYQCQDCDYTSSRQDKYRDHVRRHHQSRAIELGFITTTQWLQGQVPPPLKRKSSKKKERTVSGENTPEQAVAAPFQVQTVPAVLWVGPLVQPIGQSVVSQPRIESVNQLSPPVEMDMGSQTTPVTTTQILHQPLGGAAVGNDDVISYLTAMQAGGQPVSSQPSGQVTAWAAYPIPQL